ncbi:MAG: glutamine synthetase family protein [Zetaproteobacteria bacterium]|nr:glutamine synthetase family protein [Zetaproteobacteria bacterium]
METASCVGETLVEEIRQQGFQKVKVAVTDIDGILRGKMMHLDKFATALEKGFGFCNVVFGWDSADVCYENSSYTGWHSGYPDALVALDPGTYRLLPWEQRLPFFLGDFLEADQRTPLPICPRAVLKRVVQKAESMGYSPWVGCEYEWFNFQETPQIMEAKGFQQPVPLTPGMFGYSLLRAGRYREYFNDLMDSLESFRVPLEGLHTETGPGVYEAAIQCAPAVEAADRAVLFKTAVKEIAATHGVIPSFMARWNERLPGCSGHIHQSLRDERGRNVFYQEGTSDLSPVFRSYMAGLVHCVPELLVMMAPTVNSYKRLVPGFWAPTRSTWGVDNRTCAYRAIVGSPQSTRVEVRVPGADMNPYLAIAAALAAGLYGIENELSLDQSPVTGNGYACELARPFASTLLESATLFQQSTLAHALLGENFVQHFAATRLWEWQQAQQVVTDWEMRRYFEII